MAIKNGGSFTLSVGGSAVEDLVSLGVSSSMDTRETSTKDSGADKTYGEGLLGHEIQFEGLYDEAATTGYDSLYTTMVARSAVAFISDSTAASTETNYSGSVLITALSINGGNEGENVTYSGTLLVTGAMTQNTVT